MENENMMAVLTELLENQRQIESNQGEMMRIVQQIKVKLDQIETGIKNLNSEMISVNTKPMQQSLENDIADIKFLVDMLRQKPPSNNLRVFLESDAKKWAVILLLGITFLTYLYLFAVNK